MEFLKYKIICIILVTICIQNVKTDLTVEKNASNEEIILPDEPHVKLSKSDDISLETIFSPKVVKAKCIGRCQPKSKHFQDEVTKGRVCYKNLGAEENVIYQHGGKMFLGPNNKVCNFLSKKYDRDTYWTTSRILEKFARRLLTELCDNATPKYDLLLTITEDGMKLNGRTKKICKGNPKKFYFYKSFVDEIRIKLINAKHHHQDSSEETLHDHSTSSNASPKHSHKKKHHKTSHKHPMKHMSFQEFTKICKEHKNFKKTMFDALKGDKCCQKAIDPIILKYIHEDSDEFVLPETRFFFDDNSKESKNEAHKILSEIPKDKKIEDISAEDIIIAKKEYFDKKRVKSDDYQKDGILESVYFNIASKEERHLFKKFLKKLSKEIKHEKTAEDIFEVILATMKDSGFSSKLDQNKCDLDNDIKKSWIDLIPKPPNPFNYFTSGSRATLNKYYTPPIYRKWNSANVVLPRMSSYFSRKPMHLPRSSWVNLANDLPVTERRWVRSEVFVDENVINEIKQDKFKLLTVENRVMSINDILPKSPEEIIEEYVSSIPEEVTSRFMLDYSTPKNKFYDYDLLGGLTRKKRDIMQDYRRILAKIEKDAPMIDDVAIDDGLKTDSAPNSLEKISRTKDGLNK